MTASFSKHKAVFMSLIIIFSTFWVSLLSEDVWAEENKCCEQTISGNNCIYTNASNCDPRYRMASTSCEQTSFCNLGCCYQNEQQGCFKNVPQAVCKLKNGTFSNDPGCNIPQCELNCCVIGAECAYTTQGQCQTIFSNFPNLPFDYRPAGTEQQCLSICQQKDDGCCRESDGTCTFTKRENCLGDFYKDNFCSDAATGCSCTSKFKKGCDGEDVYWFDSCGNKENLAEDCDYAGGTKCKESGANASCVSLDCSDTYNAPKNNHDPNLGGFRKSGESWCVYESGTGDNLDRPGTRHYRHICFEGEEILEDCRDYREEVCVQENIEASRGEFTESNWIRNDPTRTAVPVGLKFWEEDSKDICNMGSFDVKVVEIKKHHLDDWDCQVNCQVLDWGFAEQAAEFCKSIGDCGADYNVLDVKSQSGFSIRDDGQGWEDKWPQWGAQISQNSWTKWNRIGVYGKMRNMSLNYIGAMGNLWEASVEQAILEPGENLAAAAAVFASAIAIGMVLLEIGVLGAAAGLGGTVLSIASSISSIIPGLTAAGPWGWVILAVVLIFGQKFLAELLAPLLGGDQKEHTVTVTCNPWQAPLGGNDCGKCNEEFKTCSEYKCKSLGAACIFLNEGTGNETCASSDPNDVNAPIITSWTEALPQGYSLTTLQSGYKVNEKVKPYEQFSFGIHTNEPAQCKISEEFPANYDSMPTVYLGDYIFKKDHSETSRFESSKKYQLYVMCTDPLGNKNTVPYQISFETDAAPDFTPPIIEGADPINNAAIPYGVSLIPFSVYLNEPGHCKKDIQDADYSLMESSLYCSGEINNDGLYPCSGEINLTKSENYYLRCTDIENNTNSESYLYRLRKTNKLQINYIEPILGSTYYTNDIALKAGTFGGVETGKAVCYFSENNGQYIQFFETNSSVHRQEFIDLPTRNYNFAVKCIDYAGNIVENSTNFRIDVDINAPKVVAIYKAAQLNIIFNEVAACEYADRKFNFGEGTETTGQGTKHHTAPLFEDYEYHIICKDSFNNLMQEIIIK